MEKTLKSVVGSKFSRKVQFSLQTFQIIPIWSLNLLQFNFVIQSFFYCFSICNVCVCVCVRERERERDITRF
jgi:hypothetical protein